MRAAPWKVAVASAAAKEGQGLRPEQMAGGEAQEQGARAGGLLLW
jgi:hypothetical protein